MNFVMDTKNRQPPFHKYLEVMYRTRGLPKSEHVEEAAVKRWVVEAKEHNAWFLRAIVDIAIAYTSDTNPRFVDVPLDTVGAKGLFAYGWIFNAYEAALNRSAMIHLKGDDFRYCERLLTYFADDALKTEIFNYHLNHVVPLRRK